MARLVERGQAVQHGSPRNTRRTLADVRQWRARSFASLNHEHSPMMRAHFFRLVLFFRSVFSFGSAGFVSILQWHCPRYVFLCVNIYSFFWIQKMMTCHVRYVIDASKSDQFEHYAKMWIPLVEKFGGTHHGYFLPAEGASNIALALFSFPSLAAYETYRERSKNDPGCIAAFKYAEKTRCIVSYCKINKITSRIRIPLV